MNLRTICHPGPVSARRYHAVSCRVAPLALTLQPGVPINAAVAQAFAAAGFRAGWADLSDVAMERMSYVIPAASTDADHAAWYSETYRPGPGGVIQSAGLHLGIRDGESFLHCHGTWEVPGEGLRMGHLLPFETSLRKAAKVTAFGVAGAAFIVRDDEETNFRLFTPERQQEATGATGAQAAILVTVRPNEDICTSIEAVCVEHAVTDARILGIGSLVGIRFSDGRDIPDHATEVLIRKGRIRRIDGKARCTLDIDVVGMTGFMASGRLVPGANAVCVTFELLIIPEGRSV